MQIGILYVPTHHPCIIDILQLLLVLEFHATFSCNMSNQFILWIPLCVHSIMICGSTENVTGVWIPRRLSVGFMALYLISYAHMQIQEAIWCLSAAVQFELLRCVGVSLYVYLCMAHSPLSNQLY